jgi:hypothetical protein
MEEHEHRAADVFLPGETVYVGDESGFHQLTVIFLHGLDRTSNHWGATWEKLLAKSGPDGTRDTPLPTPLPLYGCGQLNPPAKPNSH